MKRDHTGRERILRRTAPSLDSWTDLLLLQPNPAGASSLVPSVPLWWDREGRRSGLYRLLDLCLSVFFFLLSALLKRRSITACPQEGVCFGSRNDLIDEGIGGGSNLGAFTYGLRKHFLQEPFFSFMSHPVVDRESSAFPTGTVKRSFIISFIFHISSRVPLKRDAAKARSRPPPPALIFLSFPSDKVASSNLIEAKK